MRRVYPIVKTINNRTRNKILGYIFIKKSFKIRYGRLIQVLDNEYARDKMNSFLVSLQAAYSILVDYRKYLDNTKLFIPL